MPLFKTKENLFVNQSPAPTLVVTATGLPTNNTSFEVANIAAGQLGVYRYDASDRRYEGITGALAATDRFAIGYNRAGSLWLSPLMNVSDVKRFKKVYTAPVKQQASLGYNGTTGTLSARMSTIAEGDYFEINLRNTTTIKIPYQPIAYSRTAVSTDTAYSLMTYFAQNISDPANPQHSDIGNRFVRAILKTSLTGSAFANTATVAAVYGETSLTTSANHGVGVNDYVLLDGDLYKAITGTDTTTLVLDRPYTGATATIANASTVDLGATAPTYLQLGLVFESEDFGDTFDVVGKGQFYGSSYDNALVKYYLGAGTGEEVVEMEKRGVIPVGNLNRNQTPFDLHTFPTLYANASNFYTTYIIELNDRAKGEWRLPKGQLIIYAQQTNASTPSGFNAAFDTVIANITANSY